MNQSTGIIGQSQDPRPPKRDPPTAAEREAFAASPTGQSIIEAFGRYAARRLVEASRQALQSPDP